MPTHNITSILVSPIFSLLLLSFLFHLIVRHLPYAQLTHVLRTSVNLHKPSFHLYNLVQDKKAKK